MSHTRSNSQANNHRAQLVNAYQELGKELCREKLKVVGGYTLGRVIGEGTYGSVHIATHRLTATRCAIKKIPKTLTAQLTREIHHHRLLHHPNILHLHEVLATETHIWLVSELCTGGELFDYLVERGRLLEGEGRRIFGELTVAVGLLHKKGTVHRDLKLENVLLDGECKVKLGDLGFAREWVKGQKMLETFCGTTGYASPEVLKGQKYNGEEADIWSMGIILYTLLCGGLPFDDDDEEAMKALIYKGEYEEPDWLSEEARHLIRSMLQLEPSQRLPIKGILSHPWFSKRIVDPPLSTIAGAHELAPDSPYLHAPEPPDITFFSPPTAGETSQFSRAPRNSSDPVGRLHPIADIEEEALGISPLSSPRVSPRDAFKARDNSLSQLNTAVVSRSDSEGAASESSFDFLDSEKGRTSSVSTSPTTAGGGDPEIPSVPDISPQLKEDVTLPPPLMTQSNSSESTIRKVDDPLPRNAHMAGGPSSTGKGRVSMLAHQPEEDEEGAGSSSFARPSLHPSEDSHVHLPVAARSRTPSRTKRRSMSSLPETRPTLGSHSSWSAEVVPIVDYLGQLEATAIPYFTTKAEKEILASLDILGFDIGQLKHSVNTNACDASAALWWMLRIKQHQKSEAEREALASASGGSKTPAQVKVKKSRSRHLKPDEPVTTSKDDASRNEASQILQNGAGPSTASPRLLELGLPVRSDSPRRPSISPDSRAHTVADPSQLSRQATAAQAGQPTGSMSSPDVRIEELKSAQSPSRQGSGVELPRVVGDHVPLPPSPRGSKGRSASFTMLQRATSALTSAGLTRKKSDEQLVEDTGKGKKLEAGQKSPSNKLRKSPSSVGSPSRSRSAVLGLDLDTSENTVRQPGPSTSGGLNDDSLAPSRTMDSFASTSSSGPSQAASTPSKPSKDKGAKRDGGLLTTFKSWFEVDKRKRRREAIPGSPHPAPRPTSTHGNSTNLRSQHVHAIRKTTTVMTKRVPSDGRPALHSRRSSSANSRRSSAASTHVPALDIVSGGFDHGHVLSRRHSRRSAGSRTPTSEHDYGSRPSSVHSFHMHGQANSAGLHHNKPDSGSSAGSTIGHGGASNSVHLGQHLFPTGSSATRGRAGRRSTGPQRRTASGASSAQSMSSRRSSGPDPEFDLAEEPESEADVSHDDAGSEHSRQRRRSSDSYHGALHPSIIVAAKRTRSPRVTQLIVDQRRRQSDDRITHVRPKAPLRDVFASAGEDDWISDEEQSGGYSGGLGQLCSSARDPAPVTLDSPIASSLEGGKFASSAAYRGRSSRASATSVQDASAAVSQTSQPPATGVIAEVPGRRGGRAPLAIGRPADIREEDEEEE